MLPGSSPGSWLHLQAPRHFHHQRHETKTEPAVSMTLRRRPVTLGHDESQIPKDRLMIFKGNGMIMIMYSCCSSFYGYFCSSHPRIVVHFSKKNNSNKKQRSKATSHSEDSKHGLHATGSTSPKRPGTSSCWSWIKGSAQPIPDLWGLMTGLRPQKVVKNPLNKAGSLLYFLMAEILHQLSFFFNWLFWVGYLSYKAVSFLLGREVAIWRDSQKCLVQFRGTKLIVHQTHSFTLGRIAVPGSSVCSTSPSSTKTTRMKDKSTFWQKLSFLGLMSNTGTFMYLSFTAERCRFWEGPGSSERLDATWSPKDLLAGHPGQRCKAQIPQEQRSTQHEWSKLLFRCLVFLEKTHIFEISINTGPLPR